MKIKRHLTHYADKHVVLKTKPCQLPRKEKKKAKKIRIKIWAELYKMGESNIILGMEFSINNNVEFIPHQ